ncbi:MAG: DUF3352 domain-containing protein [Geminocystis sp.]|nr:DUF3352 domain-containing protein [Geminocystis sp.]HIK37336.1 DUF3352 domain-containing protein [Geminocystis sp. M7585_C2015_104]MCS7148293.1 DUF3352 domain-containing protein [Geminocystis sp.]MCX8077708.1 DUF3352 domain-containing protein [Geminocystis sp.]MDW8116600.1 DUF3352 domain-containing protein [Geminocystis sp.]
MSIHFIMKSSPSPPRKANSLLVFFTFFSLGIVVSGVTYYFGRKFIMGEQLTPLSSAKLVPESAYTTVFISTSSRGWQKLSQFGNASVSLSTVFTNAIDNLLKDSLGNPQNNLDLRKDILPWLGGVSLAVFPSPNTKDNIDIAVIGGIKNKLRAYLFFRNYQKQMPEKPPCNRYDKIDICRLKLREGRDVYVATFDNYLVLGDEQKTVESVISAYQNGNNLAKKYSDKSPQDYSQSLVHVYFPQYGSTLVDTLQKLQPNQQQLDTSLQDILLRIKTVAADLKVENHGIKATLTVQHDRGIYNDFYPKPVSPDVLANIPNSAILVITGGNLKNSWDFFQKKRETIPDLDELLVQLELLANQEYNLDLNKDIFSWLDGEFALAIAYDNSKNSLLDNLQGLLLIKTSNKPQAENTLALLEERAKLNPFILLENRKEKNLNITDWNLSKRTILSHTWLDNNSLLFSLGRGLDSSNIPSRNNNSIMQDSNFKITTQSLTKNNYGYFYLDLEKTRHLLSKINPHILENLPGDAPVLLESVRAIAATSTSNNDTTKLEFNLSLVRRGSRKVQQGDSSLPSEKLQP